MGVAEIMAIRQTGKKLDARERARLARTRIDRVRAERDSKIEATLADYFTTSDERDNLLGVNPKDVKRLRGLATTPIAAEAESPVAVVDA